MKPSTGVPLPEPVVGSVYGFLCPFGEREQRKFHPGIVLGLKPIEDTDARWRVFTVAVSHSEQPRTYDPRESILIPPAERQRMGLDGADQWVCLKEVGKFKLPEDAKPIYSQNAVYLGQTSPAFLADVQSAVVELQKYMRR